ncbi:MAG TPA: hypothetical protein PK934_06045 [Polaromonas sp.]|nr:hypothetical protein [Polaromonas sp.]
MLRAFVLRFFLPGVEFCGFCRFCGLPGLSGLAFLPVGLKPGSPGFDVGLLGVLGPGTRILLFFGLLHARLVVGCSFCATLCVGLLIFSRGLFLGFAHLFGALALALRLIKQDFLTSQISHGRATPLIDFVQTVVDCESLVAGYVFRQKSGLQPRSFQANAGAFCIRARRRRLGLPRRNRAKHQQ